MTTCPECGGAGKCIGSGVFFFWSLLTSTVACCVIGMVLSWRITAVLFLPATITISVFMLSRQRPCPRCAGTGQAELRECPRCRHVEERPGTYCATCGGTWAAA